MVVSLGFVGCNDVEIPSTPAGSVGHRALVDALEGIRPFEPRMTGGSSHAHCPPPNDGATALILGTACSPSLDARRLGRLRHAAALIRTNGSRHALGLLSLVASPDSDGVLQSVEWLEAEARAEPGPAVLSDLAAAYLVRAQTAQDPLDLVRALDSLERAIEQEPALPEALFNRALVLEKLALRHEAIAAWLRYQQIDSSSGWASESETRGRALRFEADDRSVRFAESDRAQLAELVADYPQEARKEALENLLPAWHEDWLSGDRSTADRDFERIQLLGAALADATGDHTVAMSVGAIESLRAAGRLGDLDKLARAWLSYRRGRDGLRESRYADAFNYMADALTTADGLDAALRSLTLCWLAAAALTGNQIDEAAHALDRLDDEADLERQPSLGARSLWYRGLIRGRAGFYADSRRYFLEAADIYRGTGEPAQEAAALALAAEASRALGLTSEAWAERYRALRAMDGAPSGPFHNLLLDAAGAAREAGLPYAALTFQSACVRAARRMGSQTRVIEALLWRSTILDDLGREAEARRDLDAALAAVPEVEDPELRQRLHADVLAASGVHDLNVGAGDAVAHLTHAIDYYLRIAYEYPLPKSYLARAEGLLALGEVERAENDLDAGIELFERRDRRLMANVLRYRHFERAQELFDEMIRLQVDMDQAEGALDYSERSRLSALRLAEEIALSVERSGEGARSQISSIDQSMRRLPADVAVIQYSVLEENLLIWRVQRGKLRFYAREIPRAALAARIESFIAALVGARSRAQLEDLGKHLYEDLLSDVLVGVPAGSRIVFVPERELGTLPFAALRSPETGRYIIQDYPISSSLGIRFLGSGPPGDEERWKVRNDGSSVLIVGDPASDTGPGGVSPLPGARAEARDLFSLYGGKLLMGDGATKAATVAALAEAEIFHFGGHSVDDSASPWASYLVLAGGSGGDPEKLFAHEITPELVPNLRLAVLSACRSAGSAPSRPLAISGLSLAFLSAGVPDVVANLWEVHDEASHHFMTRFHGHLDSGMPPAQALQATSVELLTATGAAADPANWAGFVLATRAR